MVVLGNEGVKGRSGRKLYLTLHCHLHQNGVVSEVVSVSGVVSDVYWPGPRSQDVGVGVGVEGGGWRGRGTGSETLSKRYTVTSTTVILPNCLWTYRY